MKIKGKVVIIGLRDVVMLQIVDNNNNIIKEKKVPLKDDKGEYMDMDGLTHYLSFSIITVLFKFHTSYVGNGDNIGISYLTDNYIKI